MLAMLLPAKSLLVLISVKPNGGASCPIPSAQWKRSQGRHDAGSPSCCHPIFQFTFPVIRRAFMPQYRHAWIPDQASWVSSQQFKPIFPSKTLNFWWLVEKRDFTPTSLDVQYVLGCLMNVLVCPRWGGSFRCKNTKGRNFQQKMHCRRQES